MGNALAAPLSVLVAARDKNFRFRFYHGGVFLLRALRQREKKEAKGNFKNGTVPIRMEKAADLNP